MSKHIMAIDAGTGSVRAVIFNLEGNIISQSSREWTHTEDSRWPGSMNFDWDEGWRLASMCVRDALKLSSLNAGDIAAISTTSMREAIIFYDAEGKEIWGCANVDARSYNEVSQLIGEDPSRELKIYGVSGETYALGALPRLLWVKNNLPDVYERIHRVSMINDWLIYKLTGELVSEPSNGSTTGMLSLSSRSWDPAIAESCGLRSDIFTPVKECGEIAGYVSGSGASDTGLPAGAPVVVGGGDAQLGTIGVGVTRPGRAAVFGGSFWQYEFNTGSVVTDPVGKVRVNCHAIPDVWQFEAIAFQPGLVMRWYRDAFCQHEKGLAEERGCDTYQLMDEKAAGIPAGSYGMMCTFSDIMNFISWKHASPSFTNFLIDPGKFNKYTFYRSIMENAAMVTYGQMKLVNDLTGNMPDEIIFAGGASKSELWSRILADVLGITVKVPAVKEATALGAAILAGRGVGVFGDIEETATKLNAIEAVYRPDAQNHSIYMEMFDKWKKLYESQMKLSDEGALRHMWAAPGTIPSK